MRNIFFSMLSIASVCLISASFIHRNDINIKSNNEINKFFNTKDIIAFVHYEKNNHIYIEGVLNTVNKKELLKDFSFKNTIEYNTLKTSGVWCPYIDYDPDFVYYINDKGFNKYGYILLAVKKNGNNFKFYEEKGE